MCSRFNHDHIFTSTAKLKHTLSNFIMYDTSEHLSLFPFSTGGTTGISSHPHSKGDPYICIYKHVLFSHVCNSFSAGSPVIFLRFRPRCMQGNHRYYCEACLDPAGLCSACFGRTKHHEPTLFQGLAFRVAKPSRIIETRTSSIFRSVLLCLHHTGRRASSFLTATVQQ